MAGAVTGGGRVDAAEVRRRVSLSELIGEAVPLRRQGRELVGLCPFHAERTPSFTVHEARGVFYCFGCGAGGDAFDFVKKYQGFDFARAKEYLAARVGLSASPDARPLRRRPRLTPDDRHDRREAEKMRWAAKIWAESGPAGGTWAETYLQCRGIDVERLGGVPATLRFHPGLWHSDAKRHFPAMVGVITPARGVVTGVHRTFLDSRPAEDDPAAASALAACIGARPGGVGMVVTKAPVAAAKKMAGVALGGAVRLAPAGPVLAIAEGIETALSVMDASGLPAWAALSLGNLGNLRLPPEVREVVLCADNDAKDPTATERLLLQAVAAYERQDVAVRVARPPEGKDFNDVLMSRYREP